MRQTITLQQLCMLPFLLVASLLASLQPTGSLAADSLTGHVILGYRHVSGTDNDTKYRQQVDLDDGVRLFDLGLAFQPAPDAAASWLVPDRVALDASGLGGDPSQTLRIDARKTARYRLRYEHRRSDYFYEDLLLRPEDASIEGSTGGDFHHFDFQRRRDRASLDIDLNPRAGLSLGFDRTEKQGDSTTTEDIQREEFELDKPVDETSRRYSLGFRYTWDHVTLTLEEQWQDYDNLSSTFLPGFSDGSDPDAPTALDIFSLQQPYHFDNREHHAGLRLRPDARWDIKVDARLGELDLQSTALERAQGIDFRGNPFTADNTGTADINRDLALYDLAVDWLASERLRFTGGAYRRHLDQNGDLLFNTDDARSHWQIDMTGMELGRDIAISRALTAALGLSRERRETNYLQQDTSIRDTDDSDTAQTGYSAQLAYRPDRRFNLTLSTEINRLTDPFTLASATDTQRWRLRGHYRWDNGLSLSAALRRTERDNDQSQWSSVSRQADLRLSWQSQRLTASLGIAQVERQRDINTLVVGGSRADLFAINDEADADFADVSLRWRLNDQVGLSASHRVYENAGSIGIDRQDSRAGIDVSLGEDYQVLVSYRNLDYEEDRLEAFDADLWEVALNMRW